MPFQHARENHQVQVVCIGNLGCLGNPVLPPGMTVGFARGIEVPLLVWTRIVALDDGYVASVAAANPNQGLNLWENSIQEQW
jgi:hypothetical protein